MNKARHLLLMGLFILFQLVPLFSATARTLTIEHERYEFDRDARTYIYTQPRVLFNNSSIASRKLIYREDEDKFYFSGNVFIQAPNTTLTAQEAVYDSSTDQAVLKTATLYDEVNDVFVEAEQIDKISDTQYIIYKGVLTKCDMDKKAWELSGSKIVYKVEEYAYSIHTALFFYDLPLFYSPYFSWPTRSERATGFLMPSFNSFSSADQSRHYGGRIRVPYFIALDQDHDLTLTADMIQHRGVGLDLDYQYAFTENMSGQFKAWYLNETIKDRNLNDSNEVWDSNILDQNNLDLRPTRYKYEFDHKQGIFWGGQLFFHQSENSDNELNQEFFDAAIGLDSRFSQTMDLIFPWQNGSLSATYSTEAYFLTHSIYDNSTDVDTHLNQHPSITVKQKFSRVLDTPLSISLTGSFIGYDRTHGWVSDYSEGRIQLSAPFSIDFLNVVPTMEHSHHTYSASYRPKAGEAAQQADLFGWDVGQKRLEMNFEVFRLFYNKDNIATSKVSLLPVIQYTEVDNVDQTKEVTYGFDTPVNAQKTLSYRLTANYLTKDLKSGNTRVFASAGLEQIYNLNMLESGIHHLPSSLETSSGNPTLPLRVNFSIAPTDLFSASLFYRFDHDSSSIVETSVNVSASSPAGHQATVTYTDNPTQYYTPSGVYHPSARLFSISHHHRLSETIDLDIAATWDQNRNIFSSSVLDRQLTAADVAITIRHNCYYFSAGYSESVTDEILDKKIWLAVEIPLTLPGLNDDSVGTGPKFQQQFRFPGNS